MNSKLLRINIGGGLILLMLMVSNPYAADKIDGNLHTTQKKFNPDDILAIVNGERITWKQVADELMLVYGREALGWFVDRVLIEQEAKKNGVDVTPDEVKARIEKEIDDQFERVMKRFGIKSKAELAEFARRNGTDLEMMRKRFTVELAPQVRPALLEEKLLRMRVTVTPEEVRQRYQKLYGPRFEAQQIVVTTRKEADELVQKIRNGADFAILAREHSIDTATKGSGGKMQPVPADSELGRAMAGLKEGEVSDPVLIGENYHILRLIRRVGSEEIKFAEVEAKLTSDLINEKIESLRPSWRAALKDRADIRFVNPLN